MKDRGTFRSSYEALADDPDFQELSSLAQAAFHTLKLKLGQYGIGIFYPAILQEYHRKASADDLIAALRELEQPKPSGSQGWICRERNVFWIRNGLRWDPLLTLANPNHAKGALRHARSLPAHEIVEAFVRYYELENVEHVVSGRPRKTDPSDNKSSLNTISSTKQITEEEKEEETETTTSPPPPPPVQKIVAAVSDGVEATLIAVATALENPEDRKALRRIVEAAPDSDSWLGAMASALNREKGFPALTPALLGKACREFVGQGGVKKKGMSYTYFMRFLENVTKKGKPPPAGAFRRAGRVEEYDPLPPTKSDQEIRWAR